MTEEMVVEWVSTYLTGDKKVDQLDLGAMSAPNEQINVTLKCITFDEGTKVHDVETLFEGFVSRERKQDCIFLLFRVIPSTKMPIKLIYSKMPKLFDFVDQLVVMDRCAGMVWITSDGPFYGTGAWSMLKMIPFVGNVTLKHLTHTFEFTDESIPMFNCGKSECSANPPFNVADLGRKVFSTTRTKRVLLTADKITEETLMSPEHYTTICTAMREKEWKKTTYKEIVKNALTNLNGS